MLQTDIFGISDQYRCAQQPAASEQRTRSSAQPALPTAAAFAPIARAPSRPRASVRELAKKDLAKKEEAAGRFSRARENRRELANAAMPIQKQLAEASSSGRRRA
jgi:hypothetical protein